MGLPFSSSGQKFNFTNPLKLSKGAGMRLNKIRKAVEDGTMDEQLLEFIMAVDEFKFKNNIRFLATSDFYQIALYLGYRQVAEKTVHINYVENS